MSLSIGAVLIGDEILSGKRQDQHFSALQSILSARGLMLSWVRMVGDDDALLTQTFTESFNFVDSAPTEQPALVFSFGGIGATPDDRTRQCAAQALGTELTFHPEALAFIIDKYNDDAYPHRVNMAAFPTGASTIPNPVNGIAGFSINHHHFVPGFPKMAWPMVEWVLDTHYQTKYPAEESAEVRYDVRGIPESDLITIMETLLASYPSIKISCLPHGTFDEYQIDLGVRSVISAERLAATAQLEEWLNQRKIQYQRLATVE